MHLVLHYSYKSNAIIYCHFVLANKILLLAFLNFSFFFFSRDILAHYFLNLVTQDALTHTDYLAGYEEGMLA